MKKTIIALVAFALCLGMNSCKKTPPPKDEKSSTEQTTQKKEKEDPSVLAANFMTKVKDEGEKWSEGGWRTAFKEMMSIYFKMQIDNGLLEMIKQEEKDPAELADLEKKIQEGDKKAEDFMDDFVKTAMSTPNGIKVMLDQEWIKNTMKEMGIDVDLSV